LILVYTPLAIIVFGCEGRIAILSAALLAEGQAVGGALGTSVALQRGGAFIRIALGVVVLLTAIRLLSAGLGVRG